ncbi:MAG: L-seryl-tRNA(Sec) selenium transferase [Deltaproteobacteria bacterium]|nr:L-seryl-tRNA(Sec) selenium transferase [Deltaproteobacteria bacterium]
MEKRAIPSVDAVLRDKELRPVLEVYSLGLVTGAVRETLDALRRGMIAGGGVDVSMTAIASVVMERIQAQLRPSLVKVINATGTILHTNIGRAMLSAQAQKAVSLAAGFVNVELDLETGGRGERDSHVEALVKRLTNAEAACVVNNNAAAALIALNTFAEGREVVISRGELIEIGGSFRLPEIIRKSGCILKEVGTTNRTHPLDYTEAITKDTALFFKAHTSNYRVVGFTSEVSLKELVGMGREKGVPVVEDLGSGALVDLSSYGLPKEPLVRESIKDGADIVTFSGDKLLGGPQSGIIAGKKEFVDRIKSNPLKRALRADKLTIAGLEATLRLYLDPDKLAERLPVLRHMTRGLPDIESAAQKAKALIKDALGPGFCVTVEDGESVVGGGSLPGSGLPTKVVAITHPTIKPDEIFRRFLGAKTPIIGRVNKERFLLDMRTVDEPGDVAPG